MKIRIRSESDPNPIRIRRIQIFLIQIRSTDHKNINPIRFGSDQIRGSKSDWIFFGTLSLMQRNIRLTLRKQIKNRKEKKQTETIITQQTMEILNKVQAENGIVFK